MKFGKADVCATVVIVACLSYLLWDRGDTDKFWANSNLADDSEAGENGDLHEVRDCHNSSQATSVIVVDLTYSELLEEPIDDSSIGDDILYALFSDCTCNLGALDDCFQWTLLINELDYAKTLAGQCIGTASGSKCTNSPLRPKEKKNATVAKIYVNQPTLSQIGRSIGCFQTTVICALNSHIPRDTYVQTFLTTQFEQT